jgi:hypothetical protein
MFFIDKKSNILDYLVGNHPSLLLNILAYIEKEDEKRVVTIAGIDILHIPRSHDGIYSDLWDIGGIGFTSEKEEAVEYFRVLREIKKSGLLWEIESNIKRELEFVHRGPSVREFDIWRGESKYKCKIGKIHVGSDYLYELEIHTGEKFFWRPDGFGKGNAKTIKIIAKVFEDEIKAEVRNKLRNR